MMDYKEAIKRFENEIVILSNSPVHVNKLEDIELAVEARKTAISAMQELQLYKDNKLCLIPDGVYKKQCEELDEYKETGLTPDQIREIDILYSEQAKELGEYKKFGTLDEVREAAEKQKKKKPCASNRCYVCPHCGLVTSLKIKHNYCYACGQHIDWGEEE